MQNSVTQNRKRIGDIEEEIKDLMVNRKEANMTSVLLMDDDYLFLECLEYALSEESCELRIVGKVTVNIAPLMMAGENRPDVVIVGIHPEEDWSIEAVETLCEEYSDIKVIVLSASEEGNHLTRLVRAGISAYLLRTCSVHKLAESVLAVAGGDYVLAPSITSKLMEELRGKSEQVKNKVVFSLSDREKEVLQYAAAGDSNKEIARKCQIRETTVKTHFRNIMRKMEAKNRAEAVALATSMRILPKISREEIRTYA